MSMINIGADARGIDAARDAIMKILECSAAGDAPKIAAIEALKTLCQVV